jgi:hypothetical protein
LLSRNLSPRSTALHYRPKRPPVADESHSSHIEITERANLIAEDNLLVVV